MKTRQSLLSLAVAVAGIAAPASAQTLQTAYFLDGYTYGHRLNPARDFDRGAYFSLPALGGMQISTNGNLDLQDVLRQYNGRTVTYLHPGISVEDALSRFDSNNKILVDNQVSLLSVGFHAFKGYNTIDVSLRGQSGLNVPYEFFDLTKNLQNKNYNISSFGATAQEYAEVALGHSHKVVDGVRIGVKLKALVGLGRMDVHMDDLHLDLTGPDQWTAYANATMTANIKGATWGEPTYDDDGNESVDLENFDVDNPGIAGFGVGADLGVEVDCGKFADVLKGLKLSAAINDIGAIHWTEGITAKNEGEPFIFTGFNDVQVADGPGVSIDDQTDDLGDRFERLYRLRRGDMTNGTTSALGTRLVIGAEYQMPFYDRLSVGALYTQRFQQQYGWHEARLNLTISPLYWLEASVSAGTGTFGTSVGWVFNLHPKGFNIFFGMDHIVGKITPDGIPLRSNSDFTFGLSFPLGHRR